MDLILSAIKMDHSSMENILCILQKIVKLNQNKCLVYNEFQKMLTKK